MRRVNDAPSPALATGPADTDRLTVLDGWRALSILLVITAHWLPVGAIIPGANAAAGAGGMALFFTLSGFLITRFMLARPEPRAFLIRRVLRIVPLAWLAVALLFLAAWWQGDPAGSPAYLFANLLFYGNLPPAKLFPGGEHLWSLAVEMHFYLGIALLVAIGGRRALYLIPVLAMAVTGLRIADGEPISIVTWHRVDEILAGATVALIYQGVLGARAVAVLRGTNFALAAILAVACVYLLGTPLAYARPYAVALMVGVSLYHLPHWLERVLSSRPANYIAQISYALYVFHLMLQATWLGSGDTLEKYAKRPLLALATWAAAHFSTFHYEQRFTDLARRMTRRRVREPAAAD